ncbi:MAG: tetratricopeptide repeat protein [Candidatus Krumholzibacteria bacterium]|jgi:tetratricopeptide (TPR) repeat protein|nr:tetratricopeptide repeat protein [Candidatus Krumholzibacteria bacterium]
MRKTALIPCAFAAAILLAAPPGRVLAASAGSLIAKGNKSYKAGELDRAAEYYGKASVKLPESPVVAFNLGDVQYKQGDLEKARASFADAALKSKDLGLEARAWYNSGNCAFAQGQRQADSDIEKAMAYYREAVEFYATALEKDPELGDAAHNMEITRLVIKDLLDKLQRQKEQMEQQQEQMKEVVDSLLAAMDRQQEVMDRTGELAADPGKGSSRWDDAADRAGDSQRKVKDSTSKVRDKLDSLFPGEKPQPVEQASSHLDTAAARQDDARRNLSERSAERAGDRQEEALDQMQKALELLAKGEGGDKGQQKEKDGQQEQKQPKNEDQQNQQEQPGKQDQQQMKARNETARAILQEEKDNRKKRREEASGGYRKVDRDW